MALALGTNSGFVTSAPSADPAGVDTTLDGSSVVTKHTSPANAVKITSIGWYRSVNTNAANWEVALYADSAGAAGARLFANQTNSSTTNGWLTTAVAWTITPNTDYWLGLQMDAHSGSTAVDSASSGGAGSDILAAQTTLNNPYGGGAVADSDGMYAIYALVAPISAAITGTITSSTTEADIVAGGKTLIITLTNDTWIAAGAGSFDLQRDEIIAGVDSAQSEATGWDLVPKATQSLGGVVRTSDTVVTITWDAFATYNITANETITVTVPSTAVASGISYVATPTFTISKSPVSADAASTGVSTAQADAVTLTLTTAASTGVAMAQADTGVTAGVVAASTGVSTAQADAVTLTLSTAAGTGVSTAQADTQTLYVTEAASTGTSTAQADTGVTAGIVASSDGISTAQADTGAVANVVAESTGVSTALADTQTLAVMVAASEGTSTAQADSGAIAQAVALAAGIAEALGISGVIQPSMAESAGTSEALGIAAALYYAPVAGVYMTGRIGNTLVWGLVLTTQTPSWTGIIDTQTPAWTEVVDAQSPAWTEIVT